MTEIRLRKVQMTAGSSGVPFDNPQERTLMVVDTNARFTKGRLTYYPELGYVKVEHPKRLHPALVPVGSISFMVALTAEEARAHDEIIAAPPLHTPVAPGAPAAAPAPAPKPKSDVIKYAKNAAGEIVEVAADEEGPLPAGAEDPEE